MIWPRRAPIAFRSPSSRRRSVMIAEKRTLTMAPVLTNMTHHQGENPVQQGRRAPDGWKSSVDPPATTLRPGKLARHREADLLLRGAGCELDKHAGQLVGLQRRLGAAYPQHRLAQPGQCIETHEDTVLMGADSGSAEPSVDGDAARRRPAVPRPRASRCAPTMTSPLRNGRLSFSSSHGWTVISRAGSKPIRSTVS